LEIIILTLSGVDFTIIPLPMSISRRKLSRRAFFVTGKTAKPSLARFCGQQSADRLLSQNNIFPFFSSGSRKKNILAYLLNFGVKCINNNI